MSQAYRAWTAACRCSLAAVCLGLVYSARAADPAAETKSYVEQVRPFLRQTLFGMP